MFSLKNNNIDEEEIIEDIEKINSFKILTCSVHNTYFSVNLHTLKNTYNYHHAKGQNETFFGSKMLSIIKQVISNDDNIELNKIKESDDIKEHTDDIIADDINSKLV